jgi:hypothetical protein
LKANEEPFNTKHLGIKNDASIQFLPGFDIRSQKKLVVFVMSYRTRYISSCPITPFIAAETVINFCGSIPPSIGKML